MGDSVKDRITETLGYRESRKPACTFHAGEYICDELEARGWTADDLSDASGLSDDQILSVIDGSDVTEAIAKGLAKAFGTSHELWLNISELNRRNRAMPPEPHDGGREGAG